MSDRSQARMAQFRSHLLYLSLFEEELPLGSHLSTHKRDSVSPEKSPLPGSIVPLPVSLVDFNEKICECVRCPLGSTRTKFVFGDGSPNARIVFVGEAPGHDEDLQGIPFVGRAGQLLNKMLEDVGLRRKDVYICNVLKCRPPANRDPEPREIETCSPYLMTQLSIIGPDLIVCLGRHAANTLLGSELAMKEMRGRVFPWHGMRMLVTYHPAYFLRNMTQVQLGEQDFRLLKSLYDELPSR